MTSRHPVQLASVKRTYAKTVQSIGELLGQAGIAKRIPSRDDRLNHWIVSLTRVHDPLALAELGVPWWTYRAIDIVDAWLAAHVTPVRVFEYGSGASTIWLADRSAEVHSVEHDRAFGDFIGSVLVRRPEIHFRVVPSTPSSNPVVTSSKEGNSGRDFTDYVSAIHDPGGAFDLIVIDGRAREACLLAALQHLKPDGLIVFDNSRRRRYRQVITASPVSERRLRGLAPCLPYPEQTSLLSWS